jgi:hypothetical protein
MKKRNILCITALTLALSITGLAGCSGSSNSQDSSLENSGSNESSSENSSSNKSSSENSGSDESPSENSDNSEDNSDSEDDNKLELITEEKEITCEDLTMKLTTDYRDASSKSTKDRYAFYYSNDISICSGIRETFDSLKSAGIEAASLDDYTAVIADKSDISSTPESYNDNTRVLTWNKTYNDKEYTYLCFVTKSSSAYWIIQYASTTKYYDQLKDSFYKSYDSIVLQ